MFQSLKKKFLFLNSMRTFFRASELTIFNMTDVRMWNYVITNEIHRIYFYRRQIKLLLIINSTNIVMLNRMKRKIRIWPAHCGAHCTFSNVHAPSIAFNCSTKSNFHTILSSQYYIIRQYGIKCSVNMTKMLQIPHYEEMIIIER